MKRAFKWIVIVAVSIVVVLAVALVVGYYAGFVEVEGYGTHSEYGKLPDERKEHVLEATGIDSLEADGNVYRVMPEQVKQYLNSKGRALVYSYIPYCSGSKCTSPVDAYRLCHEAGVELVLISELYYKLFENTTDYPCPVFVINHEAYGTDDRELYVSLFYDSLLGGGNWNRGYWGGGGLYFCFLRGRYLKQFETIDAALSFLQTQ